MGYNADRLLAVELKADGSRGGYRRTYGCRLINIGYGLEPSLL